MYNGIVLPALKIGAKFGALFNPKLRSGLAGRLDLIAEVRTHYLSVASDRKRLLIHVASFGELEQAKPVIEALKIEIPNLHVHLTFFSPSGFENTRGKYEAADFITYAPFDSEKDVRAFLDSAKPDVALFARYDLWPNMAAELHKRNIPSILFSATFDPKRENALVRKLHIDTYDRLNLILTISDRDLSGFQKLGVTNPKLEAAGDTRYDQVLARKAAFEQKGEHTLPENIRAKIAKDGTFVFVAGSTWPTDEVILKRYLKKALERRDNLLMVLVPHEPTANHVALLKKHYPHDAILLSESLHYRGEKIVIVDSIGKLFGLYQDCDAAYVGGGFSSGVHNVLEAAVWGKPVMFGPRNRRSQEASALADALGGYEVRDSREFEFVLWRFLSDEDFLAQAARKAREFVEKGSGATARIVKAVLPYFR